MHDGIIITDAEGAVTAVSRAIEVVTGFNESELSGDRLDRAANAGRDAAPTA